MSEERKPPPPKKTSPEAIEDQISQAARRGDFDNLPGKGRPLEDLSRDPLWWVKDKLKREGASVLPPGLQLRRDVEVARSEIEALSNENLVRARLEKLNEHIRATNRTILSGPPSNVAPLEIETEVARWKAQRAKGE